MKFLTTLFFLIATFQLQAQSAKGNWYLSGNTATSVTHQFLEDRENVTQLNAFSFRTGYFFTDRLLVGTRASFFTAPGQANLSANTSIVLRPFARYYFPGQEGLRKVNYFGEAGFGTFSLFDGGDAFETDFHFGGGVETALLPGVMGTAFLRYEANASGLNFTRLLFALNVILGQLEETEKGISLQRGTFVANARIGELLFGRMSSGGNVDQVTDISFNPTIGYFVLNRLMVELTAGFGHTSFRQEISNPQESTTNRANFELNARYYLKSFGKVLPYVTAGIGTGTFRSTLKNDFTEFQFDRSTSKWQGGIGISYFLSPQLTLDASIIYDRTRTESDTSFPTTSDALKQLRFRTGFQFFLPAK